jgi:NADH dehydrogenase/NADH:ubiquinone oxidoreductase subunit G
VVSKSEQSADWVFSLDADDFAVKKNNSFFAYFGTHGINHVNMADVIIPTAFAYEKQGSFLNVLGQQQSSVFAVQPPSKDIRTEWSWVFSSK